MRNIYTEIIQCIEEQLKYYISQHEKNPIYHNAILTIFNLYREIKANPMQYKLILAEHINKAKRQEKVYLIKLYLLIKDITKDND